MVEAPTSGLRGRAFIYPILIIAGWGIGRAFALQSDYPAPTQNVAKPVPTTVLSADVNPDRALACTFWPAIWHDPVLQQLPMPVIRYALRDRRQISGGSREHNRSVAFEAPPMRVGELSNPLHLPVQRAASAAPTMTLDPGGTYLPTAQPQRRLHLYGYSLWRQESASGSLAPGAQYGGSQAGLIATWDIFGKAGKGIALLARASTTPEGTERELAIGARWQPSRRWPISLSAERRFRLDGRDRFAAYAAGGVSDVAIIGNARLTAYGQAGYVSGKDGGGFFDAQGRLLHPVTTIAGLPLSAGAGAWAGGQPGVKRLDVGPTIATRVDTRFADFTLQLDWRQRVAGNANPKDGLALTVSTGF